MRAAERMQTPCTAELRSSKTAVSALARGELLAVLGETSVAIWLRCQLVYRGGRLSLGRGGVPERDGADAGGVPPVGVRLAVPDQQQPHLHGAATCSNVWARLQIHGIGGSLSATPSCGVALGELGLRSYEEKSEQLQI